MRFSSIGNLLWPLLICAASSTDCLAATFSWDEEESLHLVGEIKAGDVQRLKELIVEDPEKYINRPSLKLNSPGGDLVEAIALAKIFKDTYRFIYLDGDEVTCASACFFIYVGSVDRDASDSALGIHRPYFDDRYFQGVPLSELEEKQRTLLREAEKFLDRSEVPRYLIEKMFALASNEIYWLTLDDIDRIGRRPSWYDQLLVDRCHLNKALEGTVARSDAEFERRKSHIVEVTVCAYNLVDAEIRANVKRILRK